MTSLHQRIFEDIEQKIMSGVWPPGQRIPAEHELEVTYGCSRMTVSKALSALAARGMIVRRRRAGSFVASPQMDRTVMDISDIGTEAKVAGHAYGHRILSRRIERLGTAEAAAIGEAAGAEVARVECLHIVDARPNALEKRLILLDAVPQARDETFEASPPGSWLLDQVPWSEAKHIIRAVSADAATAKLLTIERHAACLLLTRQTWQNGRTVTFVEITHPGDRYQFAGVFHPSK
ncbi:histidine utilization repressor [Rhizobium sp. Leaf371]|uniref:histidine utilization repressor n=1 Tax=unclassified Rhizobium TaxID=2613769 RepID=UPI0007127CA0|nr:MULTISPECIES: histidine utilization repressor [unclassified Rhizobium]KQS64485.1 histidine utilization repressor [Rhizobium sp. Leaf371]TCM48631.1 GntR family transcriptional regulator [Rhizobium sp. PP-F2F-G48]